MCSLRPNAKLPRSSNDDLEILLSMTGRTFFEEVYGGLSSKSDDACDGFTFAYTEVSDGSFCIFLDWGLPRDLLKDFEGFFEWFA